MRTLRICSFLLLATTYTAMTFGQGVATGDLHVTVKDPDGKAVTNATVIARERSKGVERTASTSGEGEYTVLELSPETYSVSISAEGFAATSIANVTVAIGSSKQIEVKLKIKTSSETELVLENAAAVEQGPTATTNVVSQLDIRNLPINGRDYKQFSLLDSQLARDNAPNTGAAPTSGINSSGQRARGNLVNVDGADATDNSVNGVRSTVSQEAVDQFQIVTNGYSPEYGRASGAVINIITKTGTNDFHGDVFGYLRNRNFQAVNPFSTVADPAYTRVQAGTAFGGTLKKNKTFYFFSFETTRRHETGFSSIGSDNFGLVPFDTATTAGGLEPLPFGTIQVTPDQAAFLGPGLFQLAQQSPLTFAALAPVAIPQYEALVGASSGQATSGAWPTGLVQGLSGGFLNNWAGFPTSCAPPGPCAPVPTSYQTLNSQRGNFPVFEGTSVYSLRLDQNLSNANTLTLRANVSPSTVNGIEVSGENQPFGQNAYSRTSQQSFRDVTGVVRDTWILSSKQLNEFTFQYSRRGLSYFYNTAIAGGSDPAVNIPGFADFGREPYSLIQRTEKRYQFADNFTWTLGHHTTKFGADFNYIPLKAVFTVNYGGVYDFGPFNATNLGFPSLFPQLSPVQSYGAGLPGTYVQGLGSPADSFTNTPIGAYWQDSWQVRRGVTLNYGLRYDVEIPPSLKAPTGLAASGYQFLGLQKGIQTDKNNFQPRIGLSIDPTGSGKTVIRSSYGLFYDHPLLGLYFLGDASDGSTSGQLAFGGTGLCSNGAGDPSNLNAFTIFQGLLPGPNGSVSSQCSPTTSAAALAALNYSPNQQRFSCGQGGATCGTNFPQSAFLNQNYLNPSTFLPLGFQPFGYPQGKNFVYAYAQQANFTIERDLGGGYALSLAYNFTGGRHLNRPINANTVRGDLLVKNFAAALAAGQNVSSPFTVGSGSVHCGSGPLGPWVSSSLMNFFRPSGLNPSIAGGLLGIGDVGCVAAGEQAASNLANQGFNTACNPLGGTFNGCVPFGDMDANFSNGSSIYHGFSANLRKQMGSHYTFQASYTWAHAIDDSTDLQSPLTPQDSYFPGLDRSTSLFDQRHRFVFSGVYRTGKVMGYDGVAGKLLSNWTFAPLIEFSSGRPFNILTGAGDNLQLSSFTARPNTYVNPACGSSVSSKYSPTGVLQEPCINGLLANELATGIPPTLLSLDGNLGRNAGITPWTVFNDIRISRNIPLGERMNLDASLEVFNIANRFNVAAVSPLMTNAGQPSAAYDPRQLQIGLRVNW